MDKIRALVRGAVGFNEARGDSLNVSSVSFVPDTLDDEAVQFWTEPWFLELVKIVGGFLTALLVLLMVVKPALQQLVPKPPESQEALEGAAGDGTRALTDESGSGEDGDEDEEGDEEQLALSQGSSGISALLGPRGNEQQDMDLEAVREMIKEDPKLVVQVIKSWLGDDGN